MMKERKSRNNGKKRILAALCTLTLAVGQMSVASAGELAEEEPESAFADGTENVTDATDVEDYVEYISPDAEALADNDELFAGYAQKMLYPTKTRKKVRSAYYGESKLDGLNLKIYKELKTKIAEVAAGAEDSTIFTVDNVVSQDTSYTAADLGVDNLITDNTVDPGADKAIKASLGFDFDAIKDCLLVDCPYELYWFDKTSPLSYSYLSRRTTNGETSLVVNTKWTFYFSVAKGYAKDYNAGGKNYQTDKAKTSAVTTAVETAKAIVAANEGLSDYEKLAAYKEKICELVSYNSYAITSEYDGGYGDPWQLIYVFDGDGSTDVVCEGYSKAFQYLCDLSTFDNVACYTVSGNMTVSETSESSSHMWNIVIMNGNKYLVDITNSDVGTAGMDGGLFLVGPAKGKLDVANVDNDTGYTFYPPEYLYPIVYKFSEDQIILYGELLRFAEEDSWVTIIKQPDNQMPAEGDTSQQLKVTAKKTANAGEGATITYQWYSVEADGTSTPISGATEDTYSFPAGKPQGTYQYYCEVKCGDYTRNSLTATIRVHAHQESDILYSGSGEKEPTCTEDGVGHVECTICSKILKDNVTVPKLGHDYGTPEFTWTADGTQASAKFTCQRTGCTNAENDHEITVTASVNEETSEPSTCTKNGSARYTATVSLNDKSYTDTKMGTLPLIAHTWASAYTVDVPATETTEGSESIHCSVCGTIKEGSSSTIPVNKKETNGDSSDGTSSAPQTPSTGESTGGTTEAGPTPSTGEASGTGTTPSAGGASGSGTAPSAGETSTPQTTPSESTAEKQGTTPSAETAQENDSPKAPEKGDVVNDNKKKAEYTVTKIADENSGTAAYSQSTDKNATAISVPKTVKVDGVTYQVTSVQTEAFKNCKKLKSITIGSNITTISNRAFKGCSSLKTITIKSKKLTAKSLSSKAFAGIGKNVVIKVPKGKVKAYTKLFRKKGLSKKVKIIS